MDRVERVLFILVMVAAVLLGSVLYIAKQLDRGVNIGGRFEVSDTSVTETMTEESESEETTTEATQDTEESETTEETEVTEEIGRAHV